MIHVTMKVGVRADGYAVAVDQLSKRRVFMPFVLTNLNSFWVNNEATAALYRDQAASKLPDSENPPANTPRVVCKRLAASLYLY